MEDLPALSENMIIALVAIFFIFGVAGVLIWRAAKKLDDAHGCFSPNQDLRHWRATPRQRTSVFCSIVVGLALVALTSWTAQRDDRARLADRAPQHEQLAAALKHKQCRKPNAPLEILVASVATQADSTRNQLVVTCVYITNDLPIVPKLRYESRVGADAKM